LGFVAKRWKKAIIAPSNSVPDSVFIVIGLKALHKIFSQRFVAMNNDIPEPKPYPFYIISSSIMTIIPANTN
jgi:hypothetical protein